MAPAKADPSKDLLRLEHSDNSHLSGAKWKSICKVKKEHSRLPSSLKTMPLDAFAGENSVLHRVQAFLPVLDEANRKLVEAIKEKGSEDYDIEVLRSHEEATYVEMDLALGVADLHSDDAISAAEKLVGGQIIDASSLKDEADSESSDSDNDTVNVVIKSNRKPKIKPIIDCF